MTISAWTTRMTCEISKIQGSAVGTTSWWIPCHETAYNSKSWIPLKFNACLSEPRDIPFPFHYFSTHSSNFRSKRHGKHIPTWPLLSFIAVLHRHLHEWCVNGTCHAKLVVSTHLKNSSQIGSFPQVGVKIKKYLKPPPSCVWSQQNLIHLRKITDLFTTLLWYHFVFLLTPPTLAPKSKGGLHPPFFFRNYIYK